MGRNSGEVDKDMVDFLRTWGALLIAVVALVQPWLAYFWKRFLRQQQVDVFKTGSIEVGFNNFGPMLGLQGTLRSVHRDAFIKSIDLRVVRLKDCLEHRFAWNLFRSPTISMGTNEPAVFELSKSFLLGEKSPSPYNIQFCDRDTQYELRLILEHLRSVWTDHFKKAGGRELIQEGADMAGHTDKHSQSTVEVYAGFSKEGIFTDVWSKVQRLFYWEPGSYSLEMTVATSRPERSYVRHWKFDLSDKEADNLRLNIITVINAACGQQRSPYNFAYPPYKDE